MRKFFYPNIRNMFYLDKIIDGYRNWKELRFLKKHGCETRCEFERKFDTDYNIRATRIKDIYHGYPYVYCFENRQDFSYKLLFDYGPGGYRYGCDDILDWCKDNISNKFRFDFHRVHKQTGIGNNGVEDSEWFIDQFGGGDYIFAAFKNERDFAYFLLRWT